MTDQKKKPSVGKRCVAYGCSNKIGSGPSLHLFPVDRPDICKQWINFVKKKRDKWEGPSKWSALCGEHFEDNSYPLKYRILQSMGRTPPKKKMLLPDAVPSIQTFVPVFTPQPEPSTSFIGDSPLYSSTPKPKRQRSAFLKRENRRVCSLLARSYIHVYTFKTKR